MSSAEQAVAFRELHVPGEPLRLLNAWDAGSAKVFEVAGAPAVASTSAGVAYALGRPDGERITRDEMLGSVELIAATVDVPVTADIEGGFGSTPAAVGETVRRVLAAGAVGVNLEDVASSAPTELRPIETHAACVEAARAAGEAEGVPVFVNARTDVYLLGVGAERERLGLASERLRAYADAGASGVFVPGVSDSDTIAALVAATPLPLNVLVGPGSPTAPELAALGVGRLSIGSSASRAALALARRVATEFLETGTYDELARWPLDHASAQKLFG